MGEAKRLTDRVWQIIENNELDKLPEVVGPDCHFKMPGMEFRGVAPLKQALAAYLTAFPDLKHHVNHEIESGDTIAVELTATGTHTGPMQTPQGSVPATGKKVVWESCDYIQVKGGKMVSWHVYHDSMPFLTALGPIHAAH
jgi:ketosteroid isomerase-like protein